MGGPYVSIDTATLVATAISDGPAMGIGATPPGNAAGNQLFAGGLSLPPVAQILWDAYNTGNADVSWTGAQAATYGWQAAVGWNWATAPVAPGNLQWFNLMVLGPSGNLSLPLGTLSVARDPAAANEVATMGWVGNNTVHSFNNRNGQVQLNADDVYSALKLCDPIATQAWVNQAIQNSIQNLLVTCPFVNKWNNRTGSVYLMLSDITTVLFQPGQQPMAPSFQLYGAPDPTITPLPDSPLRIFGAYQHGIITDPNASFASSALIETQPGRSIVWSDGVGRASLDAAGDAAGNINLLLNAGGTGSIYAQGLTTLNAMPIQAGQADANNVILLTPRATGLQPIISFEGIDPVVNGEIWNEGGGTITFVNQSGLRWSAAPVNPADLVNKAYVDAHSGDGGGAGFLPLTGGSLSGPLSGTSASFSTLTAAVTGPSGSFANLSGSVTATGAITPRQLNDHFADRIYAKDFGAVFDGNSHPLSNYYPNLAAAQAVYPKATALTNEIDGIATQAAIDVCVARSAPGLPAPYMGGGTVVLPAGAGLMNTPLIINGSCVNLVVDGAWMGGSRSNVAFNAYSMPCRLRWNGPGVTAGAPVQYMLTIQPTDGGRVVACSNVIGVLFDCNAVAGVAGVLVASVRASRLALNVREPRGVLYPGSQLTAGSQTVTMSSTTALAVGQSIYSPSLPVGAYIAAIPTGTTIQASSQASASNTETVCVGGEGMRMDVVDAINDSNDTQYNSVEYACTTELAAAYTCGPCLMLGGSGPLGGPPGHFGNTSVNHFDGVRTISSNNPHLVINNTDHNIFDIVSFQNVTGPAGALALVLNGSLNPNNGGARFNMFQYVIGGMINAVGTDTGGFTQGSINNTCYILDVSNGSGIFRVGTGATLSAATDRYPTLMQPLGGNLGVVASFPDQTVLGGGNRGFYSVDLQTDRSSPAQVASGTDSVVLGGQNNAALTPFALVVGGQGNTASTGVAPAVVGGTNNQATGGGAFVGGGLNNVSSNTQTTVAGGQNNQASAFQAAVGGGIANVASGPQSVVAGGSTNQATGLCAAVVGGIQNTASQPYATALGQVAQADLYNCMALGSGLISGGRITQTYFVMLNGVSAADTTPVRLTSDRGPPGLNNSCNLTVGGEACVIKVQLIATDISGANNHIAWTQPCGLLRRYGGQATTQYAGSAPVVQTMGTTAGYAVVEAADTVNGAYSLTFTPPTGNTQVWRVTASVQMTRLDTQA